MQFVAVDVAFALRGGKKTLENGLAPPVVLNATSEAALRYSSLEELIQHAVNG